MSTKKQTDVSYRQLNEELDEVMARLQADDLDVDTAIELYEKGMTLVTQLKAYLEERENKLTRMTKASD